MTNNPTIQEEKVGWASAHLSRIIIKQNVIARPAEQAVAIYLLPVFIETQRLFY